MKDFHVVCQKRARNGLMDITDMERTEDFLTQGRTRSIDMRSPFVLNTLPPNLNSNLFSFLKFLQSEIDSEIFAIFSLSY